MAWFEEEILKTMKNQKSAFRKALQIGCALFMTALSLISDPVSAQTPIGQGIPGEAGNDQCGNSVSMPDKNTLAVGAWRNDGAGNSAGHARVFDFDGSNWIQRGADLDGVNADDWFGYFVDMPDENTIAVSAPYGDNGAISRAGYVKIYTWSGSAWVQKGSTLYGNATNDYLGWVVKMPDPDHMVVSTVFADANGTNSGLIQVYDWNGSSWVQRGGNITGLAADDRFGWSVAMPTPNTLAASAPSNDNGQNSAGLVQVFDWNGSAWVQRGGNIFGEAALDQLGTFITMPDSNTLAASARFNAGGGLDAGHTRIYTWNGTTWIQKGTDIDGEDATDQSGQCLSMPNADWIAIGTPRNDGNGANAGSVRIYKFMNNNWVQMGTDMDGEAAGDNYGYSVFMPDTQTIAIGAILNSNTNGISAGEVNVFDLSTISSTPSMLRESEVLIYPNPATDAFTLKGIQANTWVSIRDFTGKEVYSSLADSPIRSFPIQHLANGVYVVRIREGDRIRNSKLHIAR